MNDQDGNASVFDRWYQGNRATLDGMDRAAVIEEAFKIGWLSYGESFLKNQERLLCKKQKGTVACDNCDGTGRVTFVRFDEACPLCIHAAKCPVLEIFTEFNKARGRVLVDDDGTGLNEPTNTIEDILGKLFVDRDATCKMFKEDK